MAGIKPFLWFVGLSIITAVIMYIMSKYLSNVSTVSMAFIAVISDKQVDRMLTRNTSVHGERDYMILPEVHKTSVHSEENNVTLPEVQHVVFLKVHKAGSSTMLNIFMRFGMSRDLNVMVPQKSNLFSQTTVLQSSQFLHYSPTGLYDILCCHVIYNKAAMLPYFPPGTKYIGIVREPFQQFASAFLYYKTTYHVGYLTKIPGENPIATYLEDPRKYEPSFLGSSFTNNRMSFDFGYPADHFGNASYMYVYVEQLVSELDFVIVMEYFDESLMMLKRMLGWTLKDMLYIPSKYGERKDSFSFTTKDKDRHREWAKLDYILYERFLSIFLQKLNQLEQSFYDELNTFRSIRLKVAAFCTDTEDEELLVSETHWSQQFTVTRLDCDYMLMTAVKLINTVRKRYVTD